MTIDGFYDGIVELTDDERALIAKLPFDESAWLANARSETAYGEKGFSTLERVWARPTAEINGIWGGYTDAGHKTIVPSEGHAKVSFRLVAGQEPLDVQRKFEAWLGAVVPERHRVVDGLVRRRRAAVPDPARPPGARRRHPRDVDRVRHRGALHPRGRLRARGRPAGRHRGAGRLPRRQPARRRLARAEREGRDPVAAQGRRGRRAPLGRPGPDACDR